MPLSQAQQEFLNRYVRKNPLRGKGKSDRAKNFAKVRDRATLLLSRLPTIAVGYNDLKTRFEAADLIADGGSFNAAADAMTQLIPDLQAAVDTFNPSQKLGEIDQAIAGVRARLDTGVTNLANVQTFLATESQRLAAACRSDNLVVPDRGNDSAATYMQNLTNFLTPLQAALKSARDGLVANAAEIKDVKTLANLAAMRSKSMLQDMTLIGPACMVPPHKGRLETLRLRSHTELLGNPAYEVLREPGASGFSTFTTLNTQNDVARQGLQQAADQLEAVVKIGEAKLRLAQTLARADDSTLPPQAYADLAAQQEEMTLGAANAKGRSTAPRRTGGIVEFDTAAFFVGGLPPVQGDEAAMKLSANQALTTFLQAQNIAPDSDQMFDLSLRGKGDLARDYAVSKGWNPKRLSPQQKAESAAVGDGMFEAMRALIPDKLVTQGQPELKLGGKTYGAPRELGKGGAGIATMYTDASDGSQIVVKTLIDQKNRGAMVREVRAQRYMMGGDPNAEGRNNVVGLQGAVTDEDGNLHMVMEVVDGGDLEDNRMGMMVASQGGALPAEARAVLQQAATAQMVKGLMYLRDQNMVHFDIKGANIFLDADGNAKVADYGSAQVGTSADGSQTVQRGTDMTPGYRDESGASPGATTDERFDTHALGKTIQVMQTNAMSAGTLDASNLTGALKRLTDAMSASNPKDRPTLEAVLQSSYLKNLDAYDPETVQALSAKSVAYTKALKAECNAVLRAAPPDIQREAQGLANVPNLDDVRFAQVSTACSNLIQESKGKMRDIVARMEAAGTAPTDLPGLRQELDRVRQTLKNAEDTVAAFGKSDAAKQIAAEMKALAQQLTRPAPEAGDRQTTRAMALALMGAANDPAGFYSTVTSPACRTMLELAGVDYAALTGLVSKFQMDVADDQADAELQALRNNVAAFVQGLPDGTSRLNEALADGLQAIISDLDLRRRDPNAGRVLRDAEMMVAKAARAPATLQQVLVHPRLAPAFQLAGFDPKPYADLLAAHAMDTESDLAELQFMGWQGELAAALKQLPRKGPGQGLASNIGGVLRRMEKDLALKVGMFIG